MLLALIHVPHVINIHNMKLLCCIITFHAIVAATVNGDIGDMIHM